ncbi:PO22 protein, partial [Prunella fulvescens]|nr:PO22 protein [Prunella fulvescens]
ANVYPTRELLARCQQNQHIKICRHCNTNHETCSYITGKCPVTQEARIRKHNDICNLLTKAAQQENWTVFHEPHRRENTRQLFKPDLLFVKENQAYVMLDVTIRYKWHNNSLQKAAEEKVKKYQHLQSEIQEVTTDTKIIGFPIGARGKWH